jgi:selenocysteine lyase/cysteine desulfurase
LCAQLVNADPERVAFVPTVAYATAIVAKNLRPKSGQNVVMLGDMFPSNVYAWRNWRSHNVEMRTVFAPEGPWASPPTGASRAALWNDAVVRAIDFNTVLVAVEPAHWTDGTLFNLEMIGTRCREVGAAFVIDATQTVGAMPFDARLVHYEDRYAQGMRRFDTSLRANPTLIAMLEAACRLLIEWQPGRVREYLLKIERPSVDRMRSLGFEVADEDERCANLFGVKLAVGMDPEACRQHLAQRQIHVAVRGSAVRVSPHVYNDKRDLEYLV